MCFYGCLNIEKLNITEINNYLIQNSDGKWLIMSVLYASYNSVLLIPVLIPIRDFIKKEKDIKYIAIVVTIITIILLLTIYTFLINVDVDINKLEMPAVYAVSTIYPSFKIIYGIIIMISIFTTATSLGISFLNNIANNKKAYNYLAIIICLTSIVFSKIGFSNLVNLLYPILGALGLFQIVQIIKSK